MIKTNNVIDLELSNIIFGNIGMVPAPNFGRGGLSLPEFKTSEIISVEIENSSGEFDNKNYPVWAGRFGIIDIVCIDICDVNYNEFLLVLKINNEIYCIKKIFEQDYCQFVQYVEKKLIPISLSKKLILAAAFENYGSLGAKIDQVDNISELISILREFVEYGS